MDMTGNDQSQINLSQDDIISNQEAAKQEEDNENDTIEININEYTEFKQYVTDELFILKETVKQKL